jgi:hypothetical protein
MYSDRQQWEDGDSPKRWRKGGREKLNGGGDLSTYMYMYTVTCSAMNLNPLSSLTHSYVSPRIGLNGLRPARWKFKANEDTANAATFT